MKGNKPIHKKMWLKKYKTKLKEKKYLGQESNMDHLKEKSTPSLLCSLCSKCFCLEQRKTRGTGFSGHVRNEQEPNTGPKLGKVCRQTPWFWKPAFASEHTCSDWLSRLVEQYWHVSIKLKVCFKLRSHGWYMTCKLIFSACCIFWSARFALNARALRVSGHLIYSPKKCLLDMNN